MKNTPNLRIGCNSAESQKALVALQTQVHGRPVKHPMSRCAECSAAYQKMWTAKNSERRKTIAREWAQKHATHANRSVAFAKWYAKTKVNGTYHLQVERVNRRVALKKMAVPAWANQKLIAKVYLLAYQRTAETGVEHHVDHIVPLQSSKVCGLHCEANLCVITAFANKSKKNYRWPDMP